MSQLHLAHSTPDDTLTEELLACRQWMAAVEATVLAVALLKEKVDTRDEITLESATLREFQRALVALQGDSPL